MDSMLARAQGYVNLDVFGVVTFTGSFAFELGPTRTVDIVNTIASPGAVSSRTLRTMTIGASSVYGFIGWNGPWFLDGNDDKTLNRDNQGNPLPGEVNSAATGFALNNLSVGLFVGLDTTVTDPAGFVAMEFDLDSFESVGMAFLDVAATMHVSMNVGLSLNSVSAVNFSSTFNEATPLFDLDADGFITVGDLRNLHGSTSFSTLFTSQDDATKELALDTVVRALDSDHDGVLTTTEATAFVSAPGLLDSRGHLQYRQRSRNISRL